MSRYWLMWLFLCAASSAQAHQLSTAYLDATQTPTGEVIMSLQLPLADLNSAVTLDADNDGQLRWGEVLDRAEHIEVYLRQHLIPARGDHPCKLAFSSLWKVDQHFQAGYLVVPIRAQCAISGEMTLRYHALFEQRDNHKLIATFNVSESNDAEQSDAANTQSRVMHVDRQMIALGDLGGSLMLTVADFVKEGVIHIWIGLDHILFLGALLLTCVLARRQGRWQAEARPRAVIGNAFWIVTAFTLAHSVTLTATALGWVTASSHWVEVVIALSVALAALNNVFPLVARLPGLTFLFGLIHGFGFAGVLGELGVPPDQAVPTVLAFNLGVEIGQLAIVLVLLPALMALRNSRWYRQLLMPGLSLAIALIAIYWVIQRV